MKVVFYLPNSNLWGDITPGRAAMVGGTERCIQRISAEVSKHGADVHVLTTHVGPPTAVGSVTYHALEETDFFIKDKTTDVFVDAALTDILGLVQAKTKIAFIPFNLRNWKKLDHKIDLYIVNSPIKRDFVMNGNPFIAEAKIAIIGPGVDLLDYDACKAKPVKNRLLWASSPDRGLFHLVRWWPEIIADFPDATLHVTYNTQAMEAWRWTHHIEGEWARAISQGADLPGVSYLSGIRRDLFIREQKEASLMAMPHEILAPGETFSMLPLEMLAARVPLAISNDLPIAEMYAPYAHVCPLPINDLQWVTGIKTLLQDEMERCRFVEDGRVFAAGRSWEKVGLQWAEVLGVV